MTLQSLLLPTGNVMLPYPERFGAQPYTVTTQLLLLLDMAAHERPARFAVMVQDRFDIYMRVKKHIANMIMSNNWKDESWAHSKNIYYNSRCQLCSLHEAVADYVRSLPLPMQESISWPLISAEELAAAKSAHEDLTRRVAEILD